MYANTQKSPMPGVYGFGLGGAPKQVVSAQVGIVDKVHVPNVPPGEYVLSWRWDCEQTSQVWQNCGDVTIADEGEASKPFEPLDDCDICLEGGLCEACKDCIDSKEGDCEKCWNNLVKPFPDIPVPVHMTCLGHEDEDGGATWNRFQISDVFKPNDDGSDTQLFISKSYDATSHFETTCLDVLDIFKRGTGEEFDFSKVKHTLEEQE